MTNSIYVSELLPEDFLNRYKNLDPDWGFNGLGKIVYKRTYSRAKDNGDNEEWRETVARCINGAQKIGADYTKKEAQRLYDLIFNLKCNFAGRMLWQLGTTTVDRFGGNSLLNCWGVCIRDIDDFCFIFENLMLGGGVGFSIRKEDVHDLPRVKEDVTVTHEKTNDADFIVPDSREGWVKLLKKSLKSFFYTGESFTYSTILIRSSGEDIKGFGGRASGPAILIEGIEKISSVIREREGKKLRSLDVLDICNIIGSVVVAGNVRRSAEIAVGDPDDYLFLRAKRWDLGNIPNWRSNSNNTIYADSYEHISETVWKGYDGSGEPYGFFNLPLAEKRGRLKDKKKDKCEIVNPCAEILLESYECCNLSEIYLNNVDSKEEFKECARLLYKTQKAICTLPFIHSKTEEVVSRNMRIGVGVTGICQSLDKLDWLDECYNDLRDFDKEWSKQKGYPASVRLTTVKPSGTLSLLSGSTPGVHPAYANYYIRRLSLSSDDPLVEVLKDANYPIEYKRRLDKSEDHSTIIAEFPCKINGNTKLAKDMTAIDQLELVKRMQTEWSDNSVSVTIYYQLEELDNIRKWMESNYAKSLKTVSFLMHSDHGFDQAPYEEITEDQYNKRVSKIKSMGSIDTGEVLEGIECSGGACPIR
jgi:ribonucleoside-triphosphate reductase (thioredoxin)